MKLILKYIIVLLGFVIFLGGCKKAELITYEGTNDLYFEWISNPAYDTVKVNFAFQGTLEENAVAFRVKLLGKSAAVNRPFTLIADPEQSTAVAGVDYILPSPDSLFLPADSITSKEFRARILRRADLKNKSFKLVLKLVPNEDFGINKSLFFGSVYNVKTAGEIMEIYIQDLLQKAPIWDANENILGKFSRKKLELFVQQRGLVVGYFYNKGGSYTSNILTTNARLFQGYLNNQKLAGNIILDEDGSEMKMGTVVQ